MVITVIEILFAGIVIVYFIVMFVLALYDDLQKEEKRRQAEKRNSEKRNSEKRDLPHFVDIKDQYVNNYLKKEPILNEEKSENNSTLTKREIIVNEYFNDWEEIQNDFYKKR